MLGRRPIATSALATSATRVVLFATSLVSASTLSADLSITRGYTMTLAGASTMSGSASVARPLASSLAAVSTISTTLSLQQFLICSHMRVEPKLEASTIIGYGTLDADDVSLLANSLEATLTAYPSLRGNVEVKPTLVGDVSMTRC